MIDKIFCMSSYLALRYVAKEDTAWANGFMPDYPLITESALTPVKHAGDIDRCLRSYTAIHSHEKVGILLSGGIDSAIIASYLPKGTKAYSIRFNAEGALDETIQAARYADIYGLDLKIVDVYWDDYLQYTQMLIKHKKSGLHAVEPALYKAALYASRDGVSKLYCGNGADSTFGGMDKLLAKDWVFEEFINRYIFINPHSLLKNPVSVVSAFEPYKTGKGIDCTGFLKNVHGKGIIQSFVNALSCGGCESLAPYEDMLLANELDISRVRSGNPKYLLRRLFSERYQTIEPPEKIPFARPMNIWLDNWEVPARPEFKEDISTTFTGEQKWLIYCMDALLDFIKTV